MRKCMGPKSCGYQQLQGAQKDPQCCCLNVEWRLPLNFGVLLFSSIIANKGHTPLVLFLCGLIPFGFQYLERKKFEGRDLRVIAMIVKVGIKYQNQLIMIQLLRFLFFGNVQLKGQYSRTHGRNIPTPYMYTLRSKETAQIKTYHCFLGGANPDGVYS